MLRKFNFRKSRNLPEKTEGGQAAARPNVPDSLCTKCPGCKQILFTDELEKSLQLCPRCGHHFRMAAPTRIALVCDEGSFEEWDGSLAATDPLKFPGYSAKLAASQCQTGAKDAVLTGRGKISGHPCAVFAMDPFFMMGSMGSVVGEKITRLFERATEQRLPVVGFTVSGGARMQEGMYSLMQMAKTSGAVQRHNKAGLLYTAVLTDPTTGGVTASFAMEGDILLAEPGALIAFAGPRVVEQTIRQKLPKDFQKAEFLLEKGFLDAVLPRPGLKAALAQILALHKEG
ncbi:MAG: acetyl-CoA carboxylase, carboxyltransferase subunit beta [Oscillospiraceae bacterium]